MEILSRQDTNWEEKLLPEEIVTKKDGNKEMKVVKLSGLQRCAREAGLCSSDCDLKFIQAGPSFGIMQAIYKTKFTDGTKWVGTADCNSENTQRPFYYYPTAVAESRAEARCLRKALGISMLSMEEVDMASPLEVIPGKKIDPQVVRGIELLCENKGIELINVVNAIIDDKKRSNLIYDISDFTVEEGHKAYSWLNQQQEKSEKKTKVDKRNDRKEELRKQLGEIK